MRETDVDVSTAQRLELRRGPRGLQLDLHLRGLPLQRAQGLAQHAGMSRAFDMADGDASGLACRLVAHARFQPR
nr:hypothetical protein [Variovorax sp. KBW07]